ncbi:hypothetical protein AB0F81_30275 [Actinoplanes sp. NPDC024001]|uniref:hypothetical protein n=1 Tax=Actinoplanes sp. NPDC024001 TaxID=3154598 RepID=UPI0033E9F9EB
MGEPATPIRRRLELSVAEARLRFQQLVRVTGVTGQVTIVVDGGRPVAAIVPPGDVLGTGPAPPSVPQPVPPPRQAPPSVPQPMSPPRDVPTGERSVTRPGFFPSATSAPAASPASTDAPAGGEQVAAGWLRRIEKVREDVRRQHATRIRELSQALDEAWRLLDDIRPPGTDRAADTLRAAQADLRRAR